MKNKYLIPLILILLIATVSSIIFLYNMGKNNKEPLVGGDRDEHGCIGSAGYTWCESKQKCLRTWEELCAESFCENENTAEVYVCGDYVKVVSSLLGGGSTFYKNSNQEFQCPVVSPDYMSEECKTLVFELKCEEKVC